MNCIVMIQDDCRSIKTKIEILHFSTTAIFSPKPSGEIGALERTLTLFVLSIKLIGVYGLNMKPLFF